MGMESVVRKLVEGKWIHRINLYEWDFNDIIRIHIIVKLWSNNYTIS
jgi:hypothetical protein